MQVGDKVRCHVPGSWLDNRVGRILKLDVVSPDEIEGHYLQILDKDEIKPEAVSVVPPFELERLPTGEEIQIAQWRQKQRRVDFVCLGAIVFVALALLGWGILCAWWASQR